IIIHNEFGLDYITGLYIGALIIVLYTSLGGFIAVSWIDVFQGTLMLFAILIVTAAITDNLGGIGKTCEIIKNNNPNFFNPFYNKSSIEIISMLAWGLGYFGQVHILLRFMAAKSPNVIATARNICMTWMILALLGAALVGIFGSAF